MATETKTKKNKKNREWPYHAHDLLSKYEDSLKRVGLEKCISKKKRFSFYCLTFFLFLITGVYAFFNSSAAYIRLFESIVQLGLSIANYFTLIFPFYEVDTTMDKLPSFNKVSFLPNSLDGFINTMSKWWGTEIFNVDNFLNYLSIVGQMVARVSPFLLPVTLLVLVLSQIPSMILDNRNVKWFRRSRFLHYFDKFRHDFYFPIKIYVNDFIQWHQGFYWYNLLVFIWLCNFNVATVIVGFFSWYFYFAKSFDFMNIYTQVVKLSIDFLIFLDCSFMPLTIVLCIIVFNMLRKSIAYKRLYRFQKKNEEIVRSLPYCVLFTGPMGTGKTKLMTDMLLTLTTVYRNEALKRMYNQVMYFPDFPWQKFEKVLLLNIKKRNIYNLASVRQFIEIEKKDFDAKPIPSKIYGYDLENYRTVHTLGGVDIYIWDALRNYALLYFVYMTQSSLLITTYSVREDYVIKNCGNFIMYDMDFYTHPVDEECSHFSHILNWDSLRMGKLLVKDSKFKNSYEFGAIGVDELGKERGNHLENLHVKKNSDECNVKNDLVIHRVKYIRHAATIDNFCFACIYGDEQRMMSLSADFREVMDIINIKDTKKNKLAYPFYFIERMIYDFFDKHFRDFFWKYRFAKGSVGLFKTFLLHLTSLVYNRCENKFRTFGYDVVKFTRVRGDAEDDEKQEEKYYLCYSKIHRERYKTDTHAHYVLSRSLKSGIGIDDYPCYETVETSDEDLKEQASFVVEEWEKLNK